MPRLREAFAHGDAADRPTASADIEGQFYFSEDTGNFAQVQDGAWVTVAASGGGSGVLTEDVQLTDAQIKALPTYPAGYVEAVPAPGAGLALVLDDAWLVADCTAGAYTNLTVSVTLFSCALFLCYGNDVLFASMAVAAGSVLGAATVRVVHFLPYVESQDSVGSAPKVAAFHADAENVENVPIKLAMYNDDGPLLDGHADNTVSLRVRYHIAPVVPFGV